MRHIFTSVIFPYNQDHFFKSRSIIYTTQYPMFIGLTFLYFFMIMTVYRELCLHINYSKNTRYNIFHVDNINIERNDTDHRDTKYRSSGPNRF